MNSTSSAPRVAQPVKSTKNLPSLLVFSVCCSTILFALLLTPAPADAPLTLAGFPLPPTCASVRDFGIECPGCGLTRSWVSAVHGNLAQSFHHHRLGWLVLLYATLQAMRHGSILLRPTWQSAIDSKFGKYLDYAIVFIALLLFLNWLPYLWHEILLPMW